MSRVAHDHLARIAPFVGTLRPEWDALVAAGLPPDHAMSVALDTIYRRYVEANPMPLDTASFLDQDDLDRIHQSAVNGWNDATEGRGQWETTVDVADLAKLTHELRQRRAVERGETPPAMADPEPPE